MNKESRDDFEIGEISTNVWWFSQIQGNQNWFPGGIFILFLGPISCVAPAVAWFTTAVGLMQRDGSPLFPKMLIVTPPGHKDSDYKSRFYATIESTYAEGKSDMPTGLRQVLENPECIFEESDCEKILIRIEKMPEGSAIGICAAQRLRFHNFIPAGGPSIKTHTGFGVRHAQEKDMTFPHLFELLRRLLILATTRKFSIVLFVERFAMEVKNLPDDLRNHPQLALCSIQDDPIQKARFFTKLKAEEICRQNGVDTAIQHIQQHLPEPEHQAHAISWILGAEGRWFEAWNVIKPSLDKLRSMEDANILLNLALTATACGEADEALVTH